MARHELAGRHTSAWLESVRRLPPTGVTHDEVIQALDAVRATPTAEVVSV